MRKALVLALLAALLPLSASDAVLPQNDAGSGRDAPNAPAASFRVEPGQVYEGTIEGWFLDDSDWYAFTAPAGAQLEARASSSAGCLGIYDAAGTELAYGCHGAYFGARATAVAPVAGTYFVEYGYLHAHPYTFSIGVNGSAPDPAQVDGFGSGGAIPNVRPASVRDSHVVVAVVDTGINPYHEFFRAPALTTHPSGWLPAFPRTATPVRLALDAPDHAAAVRADAERWSGLARSTYDAKTDRFTERLYTFPGTRVVAGISFGEYTDLVAPPVDPQAVRDDHGHGTHSAGLAAGANLDRADANVLVVAVEVGQGSFETGIRWAARQPWIDAISVSLGTRANVPQTSSRTFGGRTGADSATYEATQRGKPVFIASGNGVSNTGLTPDRCTTYTSAYTGPAWVTRVGAAAPGTGSPTYWHCVPVEVVARTNVLSPDHDVLRGGSSASGTSAATPNAAGHYAQLLLTAKRFRLRLSRAETLRFLLQSAAPPPLRPGLASPSVYPLSLVDQGYGLIDQPALDDATTRLVTNAGPVPRPETETWFAQDRSIRLSLYDPNRTAAPGR